ncbi:BLUF domain-containing protein [Iodobacter sp. LRB]|uniref:BLUF domain-containing protein n=1 Tax=unclassified Iodobacter TaxID=235634 RepID=UPI000C0FCDEC|nr:BLUF domain-containing protein [Iodobacter sp. BJB302]PHV02187.1 hypothetical protein CSQ88_07880 [Iodobacter sp. BJB302]
MIDLYALVYVSSATALMTDDQLESLLIDAGELNQQNGVTGLLLYNQGEFMQYLEGREQAVHETFQRITASKRHTGILCLFDEKIEQRSFADWNMGFVQATQSQMLALSSARWEKTVNEITNQLSDAEGIILLRGFWARR